MGFQLKAQKELLDFEEIIKKTDLLPRFGRGFVVSLQCQH